MSFSTRIVRQASLAFFSICIGSAAVAQSYPEKPIRMIVPFTPGGGTDLITRAIAQGLTDKLKWDIVVENRPGAGGNIGVDTAAKANPDGYTVVMGQTSNLAINPTLYTNLPYAPERDLAPIALVAMSPIAMAVGADSPYKTFDDIVVAARKNPGTVSVGFSGNGTVSHLTSEILQKAAGIKLMQVPYKGAAQAMTDLMGGRIDIYMSSVPTLLGHVRSGKLRAIAVTSKTRSGVLPDIPSVSEFDGLKDFEAVTWFGLLTTAGAPKAIVTQFNKAVLDVVKDPNIIKKLNAEGSEMLGGTPVDFSKRIAADTALWGKIIQDAGIKN
ncbi:MAG TPA: tripartite tricarboxylate transporter substrate binding protein [Eoetvoesiella sp.]